MKKNSLKQQLVRLFIVLAIAGTFTLSAVAQTKSDKKDVAQPFRRCNLRSINGNYGLSVSGTYLLSPTMSVQIASVGLVTFDGEGNMTGSVTGSFGGEVNTNAATGTYTVGGNCTGTLTVTFENGFTITNNIVMVDEGKEIFIIQTNPGTIINGILKRQ